MGRFIKVIPFIILLSCHDPNYEETLPINQDAQKYFDLFLYEANQRGVVIEDADKVVLLLGSYNEDTEGYCIRDHSTGLKYIFIDNKDFTSIRLEIVVFHELGHCLLDKDHTETKGIMNKYGISENRYLSEREYYLDEFFGR